MDSKICPAELIKKFHPDKAWQKLTRVLYIDTHDSKRNLKTMTEILITDIQTRIQAKEILYFSIAKTPALKINFDLDETGKHITTVIQYWG